MKEKLTNLVFKEVDNYLDTFANQVNEVEKNRLTENIVKKLLLHVVINWVACKDKLPNDGYVLIYEKGIGIRVVHYESKKNEFWHNSFYNPTHWAELPEPPCL